MKLKQNNKENRESKIKRQPGEKEWSSGTIS